MGVSGNPAKKAAKKTTRSTVPKIASVSDIKKNKRGRPVQLPSGVWMKCRRVQLRSFIEQGDVPNPLIGIVEEAINKGRNIDMEEITGFDTGEINVETINEMLEMVDRVVISVCVEPQVNPKPEDEDDRDDDLLYVDEMDDEDKMFLFQWSSGGTEDIATFRREAEEGLVSLAQGEGDRPAAKRSSRARTR